MLGAILNKGTKAVRETLSEFLSGPQFVNNVVATLVWETFRGNGVMGSS